MERWWRITSDTQFRNRRGEQTAVLDRIERFGRALWIFRREKKLLKGLVRYRERLYKIGIIRGFQWINGSFTEDIENREKRAPRDIDVLTFFYVPSTETNLSLWNKDRNIFDHNYIRNEFSLDAYRMELGGKFEKHSVRRTAYWYSMWSHRRDGQAKGFLEVDLDPKQDADVQNFLLISEDI